MPTTDPYVLVDKLHESANSLIYRGYRAHDRAPVVLKMHRRRPPLPRDLAKLQHEYALLRSMDLPGVVKAHALEPHSEGLALVLEALPAPSLDKVLRQGRLDLREALTIAVALASILDGVHQLGIVHKDLKPSNLIVQQDPTRVTLIDFGMATRLAQEPQQPSTVDALEGTLAYLSPEQTGRMNRAVDRRSDLYSFGVTLYQMLTGVLPFAGTDLLELVHSHLARPARPPHEIAPEVPPIVSALVLKLLAKDPAERYQTAGGLGADLAACLQQLETTTQVVDFALGRQDSASALQIPQRLYGRAAEERALLDAFARASSGFAELFLVTGAAGIGKSALVHEIHKAIARRGGYFIAGKFDQFNRSVPYAPLLQALRDLIRQILSEPAERFARWQQELGAAMGESGQVLVELIPELALVIGPQPGVPALGPTEAQNRFYRLFDGFIDVFTRAEQRLVLFLDDLQWADLASLKLLERLLSGAAQRRLLVIGAYRDNEVTPGHPLAMIRAALEEAGAAVSAVTLGPLGLVEIEELLTGTLGGPATRTAPLAQVIARKTHGNPFFVTQFLRVLHHEGLVRFDPAGGVFTWELGLIADRASTDNVVDFTAQRLRTLDPATQHLLQLAACIGYRFDLATLATIVGQPPVETAAGLWEALEVGLILPETADYRFVHHASGLDTETAAGLSVAYRFLHDRVQQAAYSLIADDGRAETHLRIGRLLLASQKGDPEGDALFDITNHLNRGAPRMTDPAERRTLCALDDSAGQKARAATAYEAARGFFQAGVALLGEEDWEARHAVCFEMHLKLSECEFLCGRFEQAKALFQMLHARAGSILDHASVYKVELLVGGASGRFDEGLAISARALALFGVSVPETDAEVHAATMVEAGEVPTNMAGRSIAALLDAPLLTDPEILAFLGVLVDVMPYAFIGRPALFPFAALKALNLSLRHGNAATSCIAYSCYAIMLVSALGDIPGGFAFSELSLQLNERFGDTGRRGQLLHLHADHISFFCEPLRAGVPFYDRRLAACLEVGDLINAGYLAWHTVVHHTEIGDPLDDVWQLAERNAAFLRHSNNEAMYRLTRLTQQFVASLGGRTRPGTLLDDERFDAQEHLAQAIQTRSTSNVALYHVVCLILLYTLDRHEEAWEAAQEAREVIDALRATPLEVTHVFYSALTLAARPAAVDPERQRQVRALLADHRDRLAHWAQHCPDNFAHKHLLVCAEEARCEGRLLEAEELYEQAIASARQHGFIQYEALGNELCAKFYAARGRALVAQAYLRAAYFGYVRWGAVAKAERILAASPHLELLAAPSQAATSAGPESFPRSRSTSSLSSSAEVDLATMVRLGQTLASEIDLDRLLEQLLRLVLQNAGAQRGFLLLERDGALELVATGSVEPDRVELVPRAPLGAHTDLPLTLIQYVTRSGESVVLGDASCDPRFGADVAIVQRKMKSLLCLPLVHRGKRSGVMYLENDLIHDAFPPGRVELLEALCAQAVTALQNAILYRHVMDVSAALASANERLEGDVRQRTAELQHANVQLQRELGERARSEQERAALQEEVIRVQRDLVAELSTPLIPITDAIMVMPLIGTMDADRAERVLETALVGAQANKARVVILDITGLKAVDAAVAATLLKAGTALRLLGAKTVLSGVSPVVARTLIDIEANLGGIQSCGSLQSGIAHAVRSVASPFTPPR